MNDRCLTSLGAAVALATLAVYLPALGLGFVWDDFQYVVNNGHLRPFDLAFLRWAATDISISYWHPLTWFSHAVDLAVWGTRPAGHHLTSILLHSVDTFLVVILSARILSAAKDSAVRAGRSSVLDARAVLISSCVAGVLFGIHPVHVESVAWVAERKDLLYALFSLLAVLAYAAFAKRIDRPGWREAFRNRYYLLSLGCFVLALMSKALAITLPAVLLLLDWYPLGRITSRKDGAAALGEKVPFAALSVLASLVTLWAQKLNGALVSLEGMPLASRLLIAAKVPFFYLQKMILPLGLSPLYPVPDDPSLGSLEFLVPAILLVVVTAACLLAVKRRRFYAALWAYYLVALFPVLGLVRTGSVTVADRFTYLSSLGFFLLTGLAVARIDARFGSLSSGRAFARPLLAAAAVVAVGLLALGTVRQTAFWKNELVFWNHVIDLDPERAVLAYNNRAMVWKEQGRTDLALRDVETGIRLNPRFAGLYINRAMIMLDRGDLDGALADLDRAVAAAPDSADAYYDRGLVWTRMGRSDLAYRDFSRAIELDASDPGAYLKRAVLLAERGEYAAAVDDVTAAIRRRPSAEAYVYRGLLFKQLGRLGDAEVDYLRAAALDPSNFETYNNLGVLYKNQGRADLAVTYYDRAIAIDPSSALAYCNRGVAYGLMGETEKGVQDLTHALSLQPDLLRAYLDRGDLYRNAEKLALALQDYRAACERGSEAGCRAVRSLGR